MDGETFNSALSVECGDIRHRASDLRVLATAAEDLGNERLADRLNDIASGLMASQEAITRAYGQHLANECHRSQEGIAEILCAAAGIEREGQS